MLRLRLRQFRKPELSLEFDLAPEVRRKSDHGNVLVSARRQERWLATISSLKSRERPSSGCVLHASIYVLLRLAISPATLATSSDAERDLAIRIKVTPAALLSTVSHKATHH